MIVLHPEFVIGQDKHAKAVLLPFSEWEALVEALEELDDIRAYDQAKDSSDEVLPFDQAVREVRGTYRA